MGGYQSHSAMTPFVEREFPLGTIQSWYGSIDSIPGTWRLCDGSLGTPDLRNKFLGCAADTYPVGAIGGTTNHNHGFTSANHLHEIPPGSNILTGTDYEFNTGFEVATGTTESKSSLPPYHSLAYIMYAGRVH